ncbi:hypothetical protein B0H13DRAFT_731565 [Mycena leptocephala]|nr:hypothetical protein B0H13DRAFT_731565 [Mycena leptocephala]
MMWLLASFCLFHRDLDVLTSTGCSTPSIGLSSIQLLTWYNRDGKVRSSPRRSTNLYWPNLDTPGPGSSPEGSNGQHPRAR